MPKIGKCYHIYGESLAEVAIWGVNISGSLLPQMLPPHPSLQTSALSPHAINSIVLATRMCHVSQYSDARWRLSEHANRGILAVVDGHLPVYL
jgi:hypothetical protein